MGVESYTIRLEPDSDNNKPLMAETVVQTLTANGFHRTGLRTEFGPAHLSSPPERQTEYERRDADAVVEAIIYWESSPGESTRADRLTVTCITMRFAVCQPRAAESLFRAIVEGMVRNHHLILVDGYGNRQYRPEEVAAYLHDLTPLVEGLRANWRRLFGAGYQEKALSSAEAWGYYLNRHGSDKEQTSN